MTSAEYTSKESVGVSLLVVTSCLSLTAVLGLFVLLAAAAWSNRTSKSKIHFFRSNVASYFICLLVADLIQAIASIMNARWVQLGGVHEGQFCTTQAVLKQISDVGAAIWSLVVSVQTFCLLFYQLQSPRWVGYTVLGFANSLVIIFTFLGPVVYKNKPGGDFYGISGYWCWVTAEYDMARMTLDYMVLFLSSTLSFILYTLVFFRLRGNIVVTGWHVRFRMLEKDESGWRGRQHADTQALSIAKQMILHPIAYTVLFLPIAILRLCEWTGHSVSLPVMMLCDSIFLLAGVVDVVLFCTIRRVIPVKQVTKALFTGRIFQKQENAVGDETWFIGTLETGEKGVSRNLSVPTTDDYFVLRQPKFEIVTPPPAVLREKKALSVALRPSLTVNTSVFVHADPQPPLPKLKTIPRKPLPSIYSEDDKTLGRTPSTVSRQGSIRRLPPIPQGLKTATLPSVSEKWESAPPPYCPTPTVSRRPSVSSPASSHSHSESLDSVGSDTSFMSGSTLFGHIDGSGSKEDNSKTHE